MKNEYRYIDRWHVDAPVEEAYDFIGNMLGYPAWWGRVFLSVTGDPGPPQAGSTVRIESRSFLPYIIRWQIEITEADRPRTFSFRMSGDYLGSGRWAFTPAAEGTSVTFEFEPLIEKRVVKYLSPFVRPVFLWNHGWAMKRGQEGLAAHFAGQPAR